MNSNRQFPSNFGQFQAKSVGFSFAAGRFRSSRTDSSHHRHQFSSNHPKVRQREQRFQLRRILRQSAVSHLRESELQLDHPECVLDLRPHARLEPLGLVDQRAPAHRASAMKQSPLFHGASTIQERAIRGQLCPLSSQRSSGCTSPLRHCLLCNGRQTRLVVIVDATRRAWPARSLGQSTVRVDGLESSKGVCLRSITYRRCGSRTRRGLRILAFLMVDDHPGDRFKLGHVG